MFDPDGVTGHPDHQRATACALSVTCHPSQAVPGSALWRRLELLGDREHLRWLLGGEAGGLVRPAL